jgi:hypothetical protein
MTDDNRSPEFTPEEWRTFERLHVASPTVSSALSIAFIYHLYRTNKCGSNNIMIMYFIVCCLISVLIMTSIPLSLEERVCRSNAVELSAEDGLTMCAVQSLVLLYLMLVRSCFAFLQSYVLYRVIILRHEVAQNSWRTHMILITILALFLPFGMYNLGMYGYSVEGGSTTVCFFTSDKPTTELIVLYLAMTSLSVLTFGLALRVIISVSWNISRRQVISLRLNLPSSMVVHSGSSRDSWLNMKFPSIMMRFKIPILVLLVIIVTAGVVLHSQVVRETGYDQLIELKKGWISCVFRYFDGASDSSWESMCGGHPPRAISVIEKYFIFISMSGFSIVISTVCSPSILSNLISRYLQLDLLNICSCFGINRFRYARQVVPIDHSCNLGANIISLADAKSDDLAELNNRRQCSHEYRAANRWSLSNEIDQLSSFICSAIGALDDHSRHATQPQVEFSASIIDDT